MKGDWNEVPEDIKSTFDRLGIPEAVKKRPYAGCRSLSMTPKLYITAFRKIL